MSVTTAQVRAQLAAIRATSPSYPSPGEDPVVPLLAALNVACVAFDMATPSAGLQAVLDSVGVALGITQ